VLRADYLDRARLSQGLWTLRKLHAPMLQRTPTRWTRPTRRAPPGFILPAQPVLATKPPVGPDWLYAVKHDGFRIVARKEGDGLHLWSRNGRDWSVEFSGITAALKTWRLKSFVLDGEACALR
jgi:ATP-dependent DNA ligase